MVRTFFLSICLATCMPLASAQTPAAPGRGAEASGAQGAGGASGRSIGPGILAGTLDTAFATIQGSALNSTNGVLPNSVVRLRDARLGRIVSTQTTDKLGLFQFRRVDPGSYIVELLGQAGTVLAASQLVNVNAGDSVSAVVKLPFRLAPLGGLLGHSTAQAATIIAAAAATGVLNAAATTDVSADGTN